MKRPVSSSEPTPEPGDGQYAAKAKCQEGQAGWLRDDCDLTRDFPSGKSHGVDVEIGLSCLDRAHRLGERVDAVRRVGNETGRRQDRNIRTGSDAEREIVGVGLDEGEEDRAARNDLSEVDMGRPGTPDGIAVGDSRPVNAIATVSVSVAESNITIPVPVPVLGDSPSPVKVAVAMKSLRAEPWTASRTTRANQTLRVFMVLTSRDAW